MEMILKLRGVSHTVFYDECDHEIISQYNWEIGDRGVRGRKKGKYYEGRYSMHRIVLGLLDIKGVDVDHINGNPYDNRRCNIRPCTRGQNNMNRASQGACKYKGVSYSKIPNGKGGFYTYIRAGIKVNGKQIMLGNFDNEEDAARTYDKAAAHFFGEFARLNFAHDI